MEINEMKDELLPIIKRMPSYLRLSMALYKEPELGRGAKTLLAAGVLYALSPLDLVPGFIPVAGQLDDIIVGLEALKRAMRGLSPELLAFYEERFGITAEDIERDLQAAKKVSLAMLAKTAKFTAKGLYKVGRAGIGYVSKLVKKNKS